MRSKSVNSLDRYPKLNQRVNQIIEQYMERPTQRCIERCIARNKEPNRLNTFPLCLSALKTIWLAGNEILSAAGRALKESPIDDRQGGLFRGFRFLLFNDLSIGEVFNLTEKRLNYESHRE